MLPRLRAYMKALVFLPVLLSDISSLLRALLIRSVITDMRNNDLDGYFWRDKRESVEETQDILSWYGKVDPYAHSLCLHYAKVLSGMAIQQPSLRYAECLRLLDMAGKICPFSYRMQLLRQTIPFLQTHGLDDSALEKALSIFEKMEGAWSAGNERLWAISIAHDIHQNNDERAIVHINRFCSRYGPGLLAEYSSVARFAAHNNLGGALLRRVADLVEYTARSSAAVHSMLVDTTVAIVGNSPVEINLGRGEAIDKRDVVFRFNEYDVGYAKDYGSKTDVWVQCSMVQKRGLPSTPLRFVFLPDGIDRYPLTVKKRRQLETIMGEKIPIVSLRREEFQFFMERHEFCRPTTGLLTLLWLKKNKPVLSRNDIFGFSFLDPDKYFCFRRQYFLHEERDAEPHSEYREYAILSKIFSDLNDA